MNNLVNSDEEIEFQVIVDKIWADLKRQIDEKNIQVKEGCIQDSSFVIAEPGKQKNIKKQR